MRDKMSLIGGTLLLIVVIGGMGTLYGPMLGAILIILAQYYLQPGLAGLSEALAFGLTLSIGSVLVLGEDQYRLDSDVVVNRADQWLWSDRLDYNAAEGSMHSPGPMRFQTPSMLARAASATWSSCPTKTAWSCSRAICSSW